MHAAAFGQDLELSSPPNSAPPVKGLNRPICAGMNQAGTWPRGFQGRDDAAGGQLAGVAAAVPAGGRASSRNRSSSVAGLPEVVPRIPPTTPPPLAGEGPGTRS